MKKLVMVAMLAGSMLAVAAEKEAAPKEEPKAAPKTVVTPNPAHRGMTDEQRAQMRAMFMKRRAEMEARAIAVIKKYGLDDAKAKELFDELQKTMRPQRRPRPMPPQKSKAPAAAPAK